MSSNLIRLKFVFRLVLSGDSVYFGGSDGDGYGYTDGDVVGDVVGDGNGDVAGDTLPVKSLPSFSAADAA